jgi:hypothetical protein
MKISVELSETQLAEIRQLTNEKQKGPAIKKLVLDALRLRKREALSDRIMTGEWSIEIPELKDLREDRPL